MSVNPRGVPVALAVGLLLWLAVDVRWVVAISVSAVVLDWASFAGALGFGRERSLTPR